MLQVSKFKQALFPKARAIQDHYYPGLQVKELKLIRTAKKETEEYLSLLQGEVVYILRKKSDTVVVGENFISGKQGLVESASIEIIEQPQTETNDNNFKENITNKFIESAKETLVVVKQQESAGKLQKFFGETSSNIQQAQTQPGSQSPAKPKKALSKSVSLNNGESSKALKKKVNELDFQLKEQERINSEIKVMLFKAQTQNEELLNQIKELKLQK